MIHFLFLSSASDQASTRIVLLLRLRLVMEVISMEYDLHLLRGTSFVLCAWALKDWRSLLLPAILSNGATTMYSYVGIIMFAHVGFSRI